MSPLTPEQRKERARLAANAMWERRRAAQAQVATTVTANPEFSWDTSPIDDCLQLLGDLRAECERVGAILQQRISQVKSTDVKCGSCDNRIDVQAGRFAAQTSVISPLTNLIETTYYCSGSCYNAGIRTRRLSSIPAEVPSPPPKLAETG